MILLIDNYDSFVHNLARYVRLLGPSTLVLRNDEVLPHEIESLDPSAIILSPGPCTPDQAGESSHIVKRYAASIPILGVCLGHQIIVQTFGGRVCRSDAPVHGMACDIYHDGREEFVGLESPFSAGRYHSLQAQREELPACLEVSAWTDTGVIMGVRHRHYRVIGWQFHPESILTPSGLQLLHNFLQLAGLMTTAKRVFSDELPGSGGNEKTLPTLPVTF